MSDSERMANVLRENFVSQGTCCLNFTGLPKSGKTSLVERTLSVLPLDARVAVLLAGIQTDSDARRLECYGFPVRQVGAVGPCHLDARMVGRALTNWRLSKLDYLLIDNVGNLVCSADYDLGEQDRVIVYSITEGEDTPLKYPAAFSKAALVIVNKIDLRPYFRFDIARARENISRTNSAAEILEVSCTSGAGLRDWYQWVEDRWQCGNSPNRTLSNTGVTPFWSPN